MAGDARRPESIHVRSRAKSGTALVTGASGLVGAHVVAELGARGVAVRALAPRPERVAVPGCEVASGDLGSAAPLDDVLDGVEVVYHCAALLHGTPERLRAVHVDGTARLLEAARRRDIRRLVFVSTAAVYRDGPLIRATECHPRGGGSDYARTKLQAEDLVLTSGADLEAVVLRPGLIYGPGDRHLAPLLVAFVRNHSLPVPPAGYARLSAIHAADLARALCLAASAQLDALPRAPTDSRSAAAARCCNVAGEDVAADELLDVCASRLRVPLARFGWPAALRADRPEPPPGWPERAGLPPRPPIPWHHVPALVTERTVCTDAARAGLRFEPRLRFAATFRPSWVRADRSDEPPRCSS